MRRPIIPISLALALALLPLAGCIGPGAPGAADDAGAPAVDVAPASATPAAPEEAADEGAAPPAANATGALVVRARMPDLSPLAGVNVTVAPANVSLVTGVDGVARFDAVPEGAATVTARKEAHRTAQLAVEILGGGTVEVFAELPIEEGASHAHEKGVFAHFDHYVFEGHFDCSATYVIVTGDCLLILDNATEQAGVPARPGHATAEDHLIDFPLDATWTSLVVEMEWTPPAPGMGEGMTLALEPAEAPADGHAAKYARVVGGSPLRIDLAAGVLHESATEDDMPNPAGGEVIRARAFVMGAGHNPAGTPFLGVGASVQHDFRLHVSIFYGEAAPAGYTAL